MPKLIRMHWGGWLDPASVKRVDWLINHQVMKENDEGAMEPHTLPFSTVIERYNDSTLIFAMDSKQRAKNLADKISLTLNGDIVYPSPKKGKYNGNISETS